MSDPSETSGRPLASTIQQPEGNSPPPSSLRRKRTTSQSSDERVGGTKSSPRRRPGPIQEASLGPHTGSSRGHSSTMQRSTSPAQMSPEMSSVNYTRTGRVSKAKKGLKVHNCECGRSYTRAEHLRRHQKNHAPIVLACEFEGCDKTFHRVDLLRRHQERHNETGKDSRRTSYVPENPGPAEPQVSAPDALSPAPVVTTPAMQTTPYYQPQTVTPLPEATTPPSHDVKHRPYAPHTSVSIPIAVDSLTPGIAWNDPFMNSPNYSSSSGYASPVPGTGDYANMFANPPYGTGANRTRTPSNASFIEPPWGYPSRSPTSATSTMGYSWPDKAAPASLAYMNSTSYPMANMTMSAGVDPMTGYASFGPKLMSQRDEEEQAFLFPEYSFGMGDTPPFEQYLDNFWRLFHPSLPVVHRPTFERVAASPMLRAAMIAIGAQYSTEPSAKSTSRSIHDKCMKLLDKREFVAMAEDERLCDHQALFLLEVLSQYRARRAANALSTRFEGLYLRFSQDFRAVTLRIDAILSSLNAPENATYDLWSQWIELTSQQRLLQCCYILEYQQAILLARAPRPSLVQYPEFDLPFPSSSSLWDAENPIDWAIAAQENPQLPLYVYEVMPESKFGPLDQFQSSLLIAAHYNHSSDPDLYLSPPALPDIEHLLDDSPSTKHALLTAKLLQVTPIRALLAVCGESWILSEKVSSPAAFHRFSKALKVWVHGLWTDQSSTIKEALQLSIAILQHAISMPLDHLHLELGQDMGVYFASLIIWAITVASNTRINAPQAPAQRIRYRTHSPSSSSGHFPSVSSPFAAIATQNSPNPTHPANVGLVPQISVAPPPLIPQTSPAPQHTHDNMLYNEFTATTIDILNNAQLEQSPLSIIPQSRQDVTTWQEACTAILRWTKMRLGNCSPEARDSVIGSGPTSACIGRGGEGLGELLNGVVGVLEKMIARGWEGWGF